MFSLPDINRLNSEAHTNKRKLAAQTERINHGKATQDEKCNHCGDRRATRATQIFDIFSEDPKKFLLECDKCHDEYGSSPEGYFTCDTCRRRMVLYYTWELYHVVNDDGEFCLPCYAKREIADEDNWIALTDEDIAGVDFSTARRAKHLIGVGMPVPEGLKFIGNVELDSSTGGALRSSMDADPTPDRGMAELREILMRAKEQGHKRALVICDGAYQYAVSIAVYVPAAICTKQKINGRARKGVQ